MKWLILLCLVSCGQNKMPKEVDLKDNDGDQIPNHLEVDENINIADFTPVGEVNGELSFQVGNVLKQEHILKLSNKRDTQAESLDVLTRSESKIVPEEFFSEFSKIKLEPSTKTLELADRIYELTLTFLPTVSAPDFLLLIKDKEYIKLGDFNHSMKIKLPLRDLELLLKSEATLAFGKRTMVQHYIDSQPIQETIREKTYRIFLNDGVKVTILYVAKDLPFEKFLESRKMNGVLNFNSLNPFQFSVSGEGWIYRELPGGDKVLVKTNQEKMLKSYLKNFERKDFELRRFNGDAANTLTISKNSLAMVQLKIRAVQTRRTFREFSEEVQHRIGGGREGSPSKWTCTNFYRVIDTEVQVRPSMEEILSNLIFKFNGIAAPLAMIDHTVSLKEDEIGQYLLVTLPTLPENLDVYLQNNLSSSFVTTGQYDLKCPKGEIVRGAISVVPTNYEGHLTLALEAYVENLN